ncbi:AEC family transporter [Phaeovulum sp.]|uniref:AEC family transporter n=1 Tax=Phaeovulum sp. TaxID=2934796 RepID=UPI0039E5D583
MNGLIDVVLPVFLVIGFGYAAAWRGLMPESAVEGVMRFAQNFAVPVLLFRSIAKMDLGVNYDPGLMISFYAGAFAAFALGLLGAKYIFHRPGPDCVAIGFCCLFSNSLLLGVPITQRAYGTEALAGNFAIISIHSPLLYTFGITLMEGVRSHGTGATLGRVALNALSGILRTPLVIGILLGFVVNLSGLSLHASIWAATDMIATAALPSALFGLGGVLVRYRPEGDMKAIAMVSGLSLLLHPAMAYGLGRYVFALETPALRSAVLTAAMAPGVNAYIFANIYGTARRVAASSVLIATAGSILTIWFWLAVLP